MKSRGELELDSKKHCNQSKDCTEPVITERVLAHATWDKDSCAGTTTSHLSLFRCSHCIIRSA